MTTASRATLLLASVRFYAERGWPVFPLHTPNEAGECSCGLASCHGTRDAGKHPRTLHGLLDATTDLVQIETWWRMWPLANIGLVTGSRSGLAVLDVDSYHPGAGEALAELEQRYAPLPETIYQLTGGGGQQYFFHYPPEGVRNSTGLLAPHIDVRGEGGYVVAPPSLHVSGRVYTWEVEHDPEEVSLAPWPAWFGPLLQKPTAGTERDQPGLFQTFPESTRNDRLFRLASQWRARGMSAAELAAFLPVANAERCLPPLPAHEVNAILASALRYPAGQLPPAITAGSDEVDAPAFASVDLHDMLDRTYPRTHWLVPGLIPAGLTFMAGSPKSGKTYLAYSLALNLAYEAQRGGKWLEYYHVASPGPVVYLSLEDDEADSRERLAELAPWLTHIDPGRFIFLYGSNIPRFDEGLVQRLQVEIIDTYHPVMIVLDPISYLYDAPNKHGDLFTEVREMLLPLRWLGKNNQCAILAVDHRRKKKSDDVDVFETLYGSQAKLAAMDSMIMIVRDDKEVVLHTLVRKAGQQTITVHFEFAADGTARWLWKGTMDGTLQTGQYGDLRQKVLQNLQALGTPMGIGSILASCDIPDSKATRNAVYQVLFRAQKAGEVQKTNRGYYVWSGENE